MNGLHLQFHNLAYHFLKFGDDILYKLCQISKIHPVMANLIGMIGFVLVFGLSFCFFDFVEKEYLPKLRHILLSLKEAKKTSFPAIKRILERSGRRMEQYAKRLIAQNNPFSLLGVLLFFLGVLTKGGK